MDDKLLAGAEVFVFTIKCRAALAPFLRGLVNLSGHEADNLLYPVLRQRMCGIIPPFPFTQSRHCAQLNVGSCTSTFVGLEPVCPVSSKPQIFLMCEIYWHEVLICYILKGVPFPSRRLYVYPL